MRSRKDTRAAVATALSALSGFTSGAVYAYPRRRFNASPVAVLLSASELNTFETRGSTAPDWNTYGFSVTLYIRADDGKESEAEDLLDDLRDAIGNALRGLGAEVGESTALPDGAPLRTIDSVFYRAERIPFTLDAF
jgi:hypothetical protein